VRTLKKSFYERREELRQALYLLDGALSRYKRDGEPAEMGVVVVLLRGLLFKERLFLSLAEEKVFELKVYTFEPPFTTDNLDAGLKRGLVAAFSADCISLTREKPWTYQVSLQDFLNIPVAEIEGTRFTPGRLINEVANTLGLAHYSYKISQQMAKMKEIKIGGVGSHLRTLLKLAEVLLELGKRFLSAY
jgi:hypothetical protein